MELSTLQNQARDSKLCSSQEAMHKKGQKDVRILEYVPKQATMKKRKKK